MGFGIRRPEGPDYGDVLDTLKDLFETLDRVEEEVGDPAQDFVESVREQATSMDERICADERVTPGQLGAAENWLEGAKKWLRD
jgi:hypothetical protein